MSHFILEGWRPPVAQDGRQLLEQGVTRIRVQGGGQFAIPSEASRNISYTHLHLGSPVFGRITCVPAVHSR